MVVFQQLQHDFGYYLGFLFLKNLKKLSKDELRNTAHPRTCVYYVCDLFQSAFGTHTQTCETAHRTCTCAHARMIATHSLEFMNCSTACEHFANWRLAWRLKFWRFWDKLWPLPRSDHEAICNSEVKTTWISLIGCYHKTSNMEGYGRAWKDIKVSQSV